MNNFMLLDIMDSPIVIDKSVRTSYDTLKNKKLPEDIIGNILDTIYEKFNTVSATINKVRNTKRCYLNVMSELIYKSHPNCGPECRFIKMGWIEGEPLPIPALYRSTHKICGECDFCNVSHYDFNACHKCATENEFPIEFEYYHRWCNPF